MLQILIIDDNSIDRMALSRHFKATDLDISFCEASDGSSAFKYLVKETFDCIFLDYRLPDTDGLAFLRFLAQEKVEISAPIIMFTGEDDVSVAVEAMKCGIEDYLVKKDITPESLKQATLEAINKAALRHGLEDPAQKSI
jgi:PleD family two-component response regulator